MKSLIVGMTLVLWFGISHAQDITQHQADSIVRLLPNTKSDAERMKMLFSLAEFQVFKPGENQVDFDSATTYLGQATRINKSVRSASAEGNIILIQSFIANEKGQKNEAKLMVERAIPILEKGNDKLYLGNAYYALSQHYNYDDPKQLTVMIELVKKSIDAYQQAHNLQKKAGSLKMLGDLYGIADDNDLAIAALESALVAYDSIKYEPLQGVYALLGLAYRDKNNYVKAMHYELRAVRTAERLADTSMQLCQIYNVLAGIYSELDSTNVALKYFLRAIGIAKKYNDHKAISVLMVSAATLYALLRQKTEGLAFLASLPVECREPDTETEKVYIKKAYFNLYTAVKEYDKARLYLDDLWKLSASDAVSDYVKSGLFRALAGYYYSVKDYAGTRTALLKAKEVGARMPFSPRRIAYEAMVWYKMDSVLGNYKSAFYNLHVYKTISDSLFSMTKERQLQQLEVEFETLKKEDSIQIKNKDIVLLTQKNNLQQANLKQAGVMRNITIAGIVLAALIIGLLYRQYRHKQRSNTLISQKNGQLQHMVTEKEWLLKEIHHRVKNNLQIVMSLLNSQSAYIDNEPARTAIHDSQHRVHAMSLIHQKLYNTENVSSIDMSNYIRELTSYLADSFDMGKNIRFEFDIEALEMDVSHAVPLGLILNEAITNSMKYAFPDGRTGVIAIVLQDKGLHRHELTIADNGIGIPGQYNSNKRPGSLGMSLMAGLSEDLDGKLSVTNSNGTVVKISFSIG